MYIYAHIHKKHFSQLIDHVRLQSHLSHHASQCLTAEPSRGLCYYKIETEHKVFVWLLKKIESSF